MKQESCNGLPKEVQGWLDENEDNIIEMAQRIFHNPEIAYEECCSSEIIKTFMREQGFEIGMPLKDMPTAFVASYGHGYPVMGFLAEYDALPGLGQEACATYQPIEGAGHGCGHNLLGSGAAAAACAVKKYLESNEKQGTVLLYGCPAEEILSGKIVMSAAGVFDQLDVAITWHPFDRNRISNDIWLAQDIKNFQFYGKSAHAAKYPEMGRSALDAAELMNVGVNYLREHVTDDVRMHYTYTSVAAPANIVPDYVETNYYIRAAKYEELMEVSKRVDDCARGAALMTGTRVEVVGITGCKEMKVNRTLMETFYKGMQKLDTPQYTKEEMEFVETLVSEAGIVNDGVHFTGLEELEDKPVILPIGTDVADVSHKVPTITISAATMCRGTALHHWATTAQSGMSIGHKGMLYAAKAMTAGAITLLEDETILKDAWKEHEGRK